MQECLINLSRCSKHTNVPNQEVRGHNYVTIEKLAFVNISDTQGYFDRFWWKSIKIYQKVSEYG